MKKLSLTAAIVLGLGMASFAQGSGLFGQGQASSSEDNGTTTTIYHRDGGLPGLPGHGQGGNQNAPIGTGVAVLTALGTAYLIGKKRKEE